MVENMPNVEKMIEQENQTEKEESKTQSQILVGLASDMELFHDEQETAYARVKVLDHYEVWPLRSRNLRLILTERFLNVTEDKAPGGQALADALTALEAKAIIYGEKRKVHIRVAEYEDRIFLDLCNDKWQVVEINKEGWQVINDSPVYFKRSKIMESLPTPQKNGRLDDLQAFINYESHSDYKLIISWLLSTFKENNPFPILTIQGEQGSSKSTTTKVLRSLIDPSSLPLRSLPREERDLAIAANHTWILAFDNLSGLYSAMSDALCKLSTGGGLATRKLYSDDEEAVFQIMRPSILNGIDDIATRNDLLDRSIVINLPSIPEDKRKDERTFWKEFNDKKAGILGSLCTVVSEALKELPNTKLHNKPRMADFALWVSAAEKALGWEKGEFIKIYGGNRDEAIEQGIESDPFSSSIIQLIEENKRWVGNASQLLGEISKYVDDRTKRSKSWPTSRSVRNRLRRINPALKRKGILYVEWESKKYKTLRLEYIPQNHKSSDMGDDNSIGYDVKKISSPYKPNSIKGCDDGDDIYDNFLNNSKMDKETISIEWDGDDLII